jgi:hypothetical protein
MKKTTRKKIDPVDRNRVPGWFPRSLKRARESKVSFRMHTRGPFTASEALTGALEFNRNWRIIFDHFGTTKDWRLTGEPYRKESDPELLTAIRDFAEFFDLVWKFEKSSWNPPHTSRVDFWPRDPKLMRKPSWRRIR